ncbi:MAG: flagellar hook-length control protein FliK [Treponema sp.]|nr:flagellar hook-length control protein FliK [Treponema sp.]
MELTEIITANSVEIQNFASQKTKMIENPVSGKSFGELLAAFSAENEAEPVTVTSQNNESSLKKENTVLKENRTEEKKLSSDDSAKISEDEDSSDKKTVEDENQIYKFMSLNFVTEENVEACETASENTGTEDIKSIQKQILDKISKADDEERIKTLTSAKKIEENDFDFEIVSNEDLALESAQGVSIESPELFLNNLQEKMKNENIDFDEVKTNDKTLDSLKSKIHVTDLRTERKAELNDTAAPKLKVTMTGNDSATIEMNLNQQSELINQNVLSSNTQVASSEGSNFQAMLNNQLQANASEIVKAGNIVLKDNNKGTINLVLHPDDLGNVKLQLSLDGKSISGTIIVNTKEALEVFKDNNQTLREAFIKNGFENAEFDVAFNNGSQNNSNQNFEEQHQSNMNAFFARREFSSLNSISDLQDISEVNEEFSKITKVGINIVA